MNYVTWHMSVKQLALHPNNRINPHSKTEIDKQLQSGKSDWLPPKFKIQYGYHLIKLSLFLLFSVYIPGKSVDIP